MLDIFVFHDFPTINFLTNPISMDDTKIMNYKNYWIAKLTTTTNDATTNDLLDNLLTFPNFNGIYYYIQYSNHMMILKDLFFYINLFNHYKLTMKYHHQQILKVYILFSSYLMEFDSTYQIFVQVEENYILFQQNLLIELVNF